MKVFADPIITAEVIIQKNKRVCKFTVPISGHFIPPTSKHKFAKVLVLHLGLGDRGKRVRSGHRYYPGLELPVGCVDTNAIPTVTSKEPVNTINLPAE